MALQVFKLRDGEAHSAMRSRMAAIVSAIGSTEARIGSEGKRMFAAFSKPKHQRERGDHSAWVRRSIRAIKADQEQWLEVEYNTGGAWLHGRRVQGRGQATPQ